MTNNQEKLLRGKLTKWLQARGETPGDVERKTNAWLQYFDGIKKPVVALAACTWLCSGAVILPEDMPKVEQAVKVAEINRVDPLRFSRPMAVFEAFPSTGLKEAPIDPDTVPTLHLAKRFDSGLAIYDVDYGVESRKNMRKIINTHFGPDSNPWCLLQGDGEGNLTEDSLEYWNYYDAYPKQVAFVDGKLAAFSANDKSKKVWWDRMDESHEDIVVLGRIKGDPLGRSASCCFNPRTGNVRYEDIVRRHDDVIVERYANIADRDYTIDIFVDPKKKEKIISVDIPDGVTEIGRAAFYGCTSLKEIHIPDSVNEIGGNAFYNCSSLKKIRVSDNVTKIGDEVFAGCISLKRIRIPDGVMEIGGSAFYVCSSLQEIHIPDGVTKIGWDAFNGCTSLREVHIPGSVTEIGAGAFMGCSSLQEIHIPDGVEKIRLEAFRDCTSLREVHIPGSVTEIGWDAFNGCTSLKEVHVPDSVKEIGDWTFAGCTSLKEAHISATAPQALIDMIRKAIPPGCALVRDLLDEDLSALDGLGLPKEDIDVLSQTGCFKVKDFDFVIKDDGRVWCCIGETAVRLEDAIKHVEEDLSQEEGASQSKGVRM